ncbi:MAG: type IV secretion system protein, partial [Alphaproteobacteria bacterium]|nr:type IV secretion system protein [Alphaproteobacteria bacterium]
MAKRKIHIALLSMAGLLVLAFLSVTAYALWHTPHADVPEVEITGARLQTKLEISGAWAQYVQPLPSATGMAAYRAASGSTPGTSELKTGKCDYESYMAPPGKCYFCPIFKAIFNVASTLALRSYNLFAQSLAVLVLVVFAVWVSFYVLKQVSALEVKKPSKMIQELLVQTFKVLVVVLILKVSYFQVLGLTVSPVFNTGMAYVQSISGTSGGCANADYMNPLMCYDQKVDSSASGGLPLSMGRNVLCSIKAMQDKVYVMVAYGKSIRCIGWREEAIIPSILPSFPYVITGDLLIIGGLVLLVAFPWCLVDCVLNMALASALLPVAIAAWPFKWTKPYMNKVWDMFMNAMFQFVFLSLILYIIMSVLDNFMAGFTQGSPGAYPTDYEGIIHPVRGLAFWGVNALKLMMTCLLGWVFLDQAKEIAGKFVNAPSVNVGQSTGGFFAQVGKRLAVGSPSKNNGKVGGAVGASARLAKLGSEGFSRVAIQPLRRNINETRNEAIRTQGTAVRDAQGNITGYEMQQKNLFGRTVTQKVTLTEDGKMSYSREKLNRTGSVSTNKTKDHLLSVKEVRAADGRILSQDISWNTPLANHLIRKDGSIDEQVSAKIESQTTMPKEMLYAAVANKVLESRNLNLDGKFSSRQVSYENGKLSIHQINRDGSVSDIEMDMKRNTGEKNSQALINYHFTDRGGHKTHITDNGIMTRRIDEKDGV